jgi:tetratricopeptide (TPR) repeat protein
MWSTKTQETQIVYAGKPLEAGVPYSLVVKTNTGKSSQEDGSPNGKQKASNLGFTILHPSEATLVQREAAQISPTPLNNEADALTLAQLYANYVLPKSALPTYQLPTDRFQTYNLTSDAISILESLLQEGKQSPLIHRTLGDLYWQTGLIRLAEAHYLQAINLVQGPEDLEDWTMAQHSLGQLYAAIGDRKQTLQHYAQARLGYIFLGNSQLAEDLQRRIEKLGKELLDLPGAEKTRKESGQRRSTEPPQELSLNLSLPYPFVIDGVPTG